LAKILIVEDDQPFADALAFTLRLEGHEVLVAGTADEAIRLGLAQRPDVVVADWMLKNDLHGGQVCRRIHSACPQVKTIIMTGYLDAVREAGQWSEYRETVIEKPFHKKDILEVINQALSYAAAP
jgi:DNA-binding NtrC family response regulator